MTRRRSGGTLIEHRAIVYCIVDDGADHFPIHFYFEHRVPAGFPSPAGDYLDPRLDLNDLVVKHPAATFFVRVEGESMIGAGIHSGDILVVDRAATPKGTQVVVAVIDGEFTVKRILHRAGRVFLVSENPAMQPMELADGMHLEVWGVVTYVIHPVD